MTQNEERIVQFAYCTMQPLILYMHLAEKLTLHCTFSTTNFYVAVRLFLHSEAIAQLFITCKIMK